ncbi:MAG: TlpA family protein disulfide reductase [Deltaproteobacteria bacterium]|nr:TlpA family protein disulfide reductase [Deltaproteobacteria bacterium]
MRRGLWTGFIIAGIAVIAVSAFEFWGRLGQGDIAPDLRLPALDGTTKSLSEHQGNLVLLHFWATWCPPCRKEIHALDRMARTFAGKGLVVLSISEDQQNAREILTRFKQSYPFSFPVLLDERGEAADLYRVFSLPETILIDTQGMIIKRFDGPQEWDSIRLLKYVEALLPPEKKR